jgi:hypothetical protein
MQEAEQTWLEGLDTFTASVANLLAFKDIPVPGGAVFDVLVSRPGQQAVGLDGQSPGMTFNPAMLWGVINLGDESTSLVFLNLPAHEIQTELRERGSEYPPVRLRVDPGEGVRFPVDGLLVAGCTLDKHEADLLLLIRQSKPRLSRSLPAWPKTQE